MEEEIYAITFWALGFLRWMDFSRTHGRSQEEPCPYFTERQRQRQRQTETEEPLDRLFGSLPSFCPPAQPASLTYATFGF